MNSKRPPKENGMAKQVTGRDNLPDFDNKRAAVNSIISPDSDIGAELVVCQWHS